jgi:hypothetical protein
MVVLFIICFLGFILFTALIPKEKIDEIERQKAIQKRYKDETNWIRTGSTVQLHGSTKMAWDLERILEAEEDKLGRWLTDYEVQTIENQFREELAKIGVKYTGDALFMYKLDRNGRAFPNRPIKDYRH